MTVYRDRFGRVVTDSAWIGETTAHPVKTVPSWLTHMRYVFSRKKKSQTDVAAPDREVRLVTTGNISWVGFNVK
jgi:hypothetical protein